MVKKTISDSLAAIVSLRDSLHELLNTSQNLRAVGAKLVRHDKEIKEHGVSVSPLELSRFNDAVQDALEVYNDTEALVTPPVRAAEPREIGSQLYRWFVCNTSFADQLQHATDIPERMKTFIHSQLARWPRTEEQTEILKGFWAADTERFDNDAALQRDVTELEELLRTSYPHAKPNSDCTLEVWARSAIINREGALAELQVERDALLNIAGLLTVTDEDNGVVSLEFVTEDAAEAFVQKYSPTVDFDDLSSTDRATVSNNRTIRNAEANESKPYFKYAVGSVMSANSGFPTLPITKRLVAEDGSIWYMLGRGAEHTSRSEFDLDRDWECIRKVPGQPEWRYLKHATFTRKRDSLCDHAQIIVRRRVLDENSAPAYLLDSVEGGHEFFMTESELDRNYYIRKD